jgi:hypothetical protein
MFVGGGWWLSLNRDVCRPVMCKVHRSVMCSVSYLLISLVRLITEHVYTAGMSELVKEDCTALAFILGRALPGSAQKTTFFFSN